MKAIKAFLIIVILNFFFGQSFGATFVINNLDGPGEGFNDPVLGSDRFNAITYAANLWGNCILNAFPDETITIDARMDPMGGSETQAVLGSSSPKTFYSNFGSSDPAFVSDTWYADALANHLHGSDINSGAAEIAMTFNSDVDNSTVLGQQDWYYGTDGNVGGDIDFVTVVLHEIGHGLNFYDLIDSKGIFTRSTPGIYDRFLMDGSGTSLVDMKLSGRKAALISGDLYWSGENGALGNGGQPPKIYAPDPYEPGSSISHLDEGVHGDELMSPYYSGVDHTISAIELGMLQDMGWDVVIPPILLEGDANRDGVVSAGDYSSVQANFGSTGEPGIPGDANGDGVVSAGDYSSVQANFGNTSGVGIVPEPATISLLVTVSVMLLNRKMG